MKRIVLTGSESTGKSSLATRLGAHYGVEVVPEFVREYAETKPGPIDFSDHGPIARGQIALEDRHIARAERLLIQDTDLLSTVVYCGHYFERCPAWIAETARARRPDLYLLMDIDVPWVADPVRDRGHMREEMHALFRDAVETSGAPFAVIRGAWEQRFAAAVDVIEAVLARSATRSASPG